MASDVIGEGVIVITADTSAYEKTLSKTPKAAEEAATAAATSIASAFGAAAKKLQQSSLISEMETITALGIQVGGTFSQVSSVLTSLIRPVAIVTTAFGPLGIAIAGAGVVAAGGALAMKAIGNAALEAREDLAKLGVVANAADSAALDKYKESSTQLRIAFDELAIGIGSEVAPALAKLANLLTAFVQAIEDKRSATEAFREDLSLIARVAGGVLSLGLSEVAYALFEYGAAAAEATDYVEDLKAAQMALTEHTKAAEKFLEIQRDALLTMTGADDDLLRVYKQLDKIDEVTKEYVDTLNMQDEATKKVAEAALASAEVRKRQLLDQYAETKAKKEDAKADRERAKQERERLADAAAVNRMLTDRNRARARLADIEETANARALSDEAEIQAAYEARVRQIRELQTENVELAQVESALAAAEAARSRELDKLHTKQDAELQKLIEGMQKVGREAESLRKTLIKDLFAEAAQAFGDMTEQIVGSIADVTAFNLDQITASLQASDEALQQVTDTHNTMHEHLLELLAERKEAESAADKARLDAEIADLETKIANHNAKLRMVDDLSDHMAKEARRAFIADRAASILEVEIQGAIATITALAQLGPIAGAFAAIGVQTATQTAAALIANKPVPEFPGGLSPDHRQLVAVQRGEPVLSRRAAQLLPPGMLDRLEAGEAPRPTAVNVVLGRRVLAQAVEAVSSADYRPDSRAGKRRRNRG